MRDLENNVPDSKHGMIDKNVSPGDWVVVTTHGGDTFQGILMPRYASMDKKHVVLKLKSGYNLGILSVKVKSISKSENNLELLQAVDAKPRIQIEKGNLQSVPKLHCWHRGTMPAKWIIDRRSAVCLHQRFMMLYRARKYASIDADFMFNEYSENLEPHHWTQISNRIAEKVRSGCYRGIVVSHGTDTMHYTAAALSFALHNLPIPVVLVGSQRSSDRPSSDGALNLIGATIFAIESPYAGVFVAMHGGTSDDIISVIWGQS
jgi:glutamyl-tRNA(Gln) amidotransferase subunit D